MRIFSSTLLLLVIVSCNNRIADKKKLLDEIVKTEKGVLRGLELGSTPEEVKNAEEKKRLTEEHHDYLFYEFAIDSLSTYTMSYSFEDNALTEIRADIYLPSDSSATQLSTELIEYLSKKYNAPDNNTPGTWAWPTFYNNMHIRIELKDESADYNFVGKLSLVIYKEPEAAT